jgi:hypothetical protein
MLFLIEAEDLLDRHVEEFCDPERDLDGWVVLIAFDGVDRPAGDPEEFGQLFLGHVVHGPVHLDLVLHLGLVLIFPGIVIRKCRIEPHEKDYDSTQSKTEGEGELPDMV